jgi:hypothetical protein
MIIFFFAKFNCVAYFPDFPDSTEKSNSMIEMPPMKANRRSESDALNWDADFSDLRKNLRSLAIHAQHKTQESGMVTNDLAGFTPGCR